MSNYNYKSQRLLNLERRVTKQLRAKDNAMSKQQNEIVQKDAVISEKNSVIDEKEAEISRLKANIADFENKSFEKERKHRGDLLKMYQHNLGLERKIKHLENSHEGEQNVLLQWQKNQNRVLEEECKQLRSQLKEAKNETRIAERKYMDLEDDMEVLSVLFLCRGDSSDTDTDSSME
ncbi:unnamed protein product [Orchesella dallaii]|uniref:Uncharacterized protein n=1 Tax=Orchesella dallaii TaxID=48710 RepID=A0ABP1PT91_9HEXA